MGRLTRQPLTWIMLVALGLRLTGLFWGLPGADGWDDDGFAPRNFLTALALTWAPGKYFTYPPLHAIILALPSLPVAAWALAHAPSLHPADVIATITQPKYMTVFAVIARMIAIAMSLGIILLVGQMTRLVAGPRAGLFAAAACTLGVGLTYYGQVSNLDVPYLFWAMLALWLAMRAAVEQAPRRLWWAALAAAAAIATKDQAYALFVLAVPAWLALWFAADAWARRNVRSLLSTMAIAAVVAIGLLLLIDGAITNPAGFLARVHFLAGPASQDYAEYARGPLGWFGLLRDMALKFAWGPDVAVLALVVAGLVLHLRRTRGAPWVAGLLPVLAILSFTIGFNLTALRTDERFLLPQGVLSCIYVGIAAEALAFAMPLALCQIGRVALVVIALLALHRAVAVDAAMLFDTRYDAARWLAVEARPGDGIEVYDRNWLLPHLPANTRAWRVGAAAPHTRNPLTGVVELQAPYEAIGARNPRFVVISAVWARRWLDQPAPLPPGRIYSVLERRDFQDRQTRHFFATLVNGQMNYRLAHVARPQGLFWPVLHIHDSLNEPIAIYERTP